MARITLIILATATVLSAVSYSEKPDTVLELTQGSGNYQVGVMGSEGPYRLIATGSRIYLLDQLNDRALCYDTAGFFVSESKTPFRAADMAVDNQNRIWLLENRSQPAQIVILEAGKETSRLSIEYEVKQPITAIVVHPPESLLVLSGNKVFITLHEKGGILSCSTGSTLELKPLDLDSLGALEVSGARNLGVETGYSGRATELLLAYGWGMLWIGTEQYIQDKSGSFTLRDVMVLSESTEPPPYISIPSNYYSYDVGWRNVAVDPRGDVYVFTSTPEGKACILRWHAIY